MRYGNVFGFRGLCASVLLSIKSKMKYLTITNPKMTRFIMLNRVLILLSNLFKRMRGGEIFVPKLPSITVEEIANYMAPNYPKNIGIRPGENKKLCPSDDSHNVIEFKIFLLLTIDSNQQYD